MELKIQGNEGYPYLVCFKEMVGYGLTSEIIAGAVPQGPTVAAVSDIKSSIQALPGVDSFVAASIQPSESLWNVNSAPYGHPHFKSLTASLAEAATDQGLPLDRLPDPLRAVMMLQRLCCECANPVQAQVR